MESYSDPAYEITGREDIINLPDVKQRAESIKPWHVEYGDNPVSFAEFATKSEAKQYVTGTGSAHAHVVVYSDEEEELTALIALLETCGKPDMLSVSGTDPRYLVNEDYMRDYAVERAEDWWGVGVQHQLYFYVDWDGFADELKQDMTRTIFRGGTYYLKD
jgi:hypothetical protein